jgi:hypothetical protein
MKLLKNKLLHLFHLDKKIKLHKHQEKSWRYNKNMDKIYNNDEEF